MLNCSVDDNRQCLNMQYKSLQNNRSHLIDNSDSDQDTERPLNYYLIYTKEDEDDQEQKKSDLS